MKTLLAFIKATYYYSVSSLRMQRARKLLQDDLVHVTREGVRLEVYPGKKLQSPFDFIVKFRQPGRRERTPAHVHLIVEMYVKHAYNPDLTLQLKKHILTMLDNIQPVTSFPPKLQFFQPSHVEPFKLLDNVGEFSVEFLLAAIELVAIQEATNYPNGTLTQSLYECFGIKDRFSVIQRAVWRGS